MRKAHSVECLSDLFHDRFPVEVRTAGERLWYQGAVELTEVEPDVVWACVEDGDRQRVALRCDGHDDDGPVWTLGCDCDDARSGTPCAHGWASLLECDGNDVELGRRCRTRGAAQIRLTPGTERMEARGGEPDRRRRHLDALLDSLRGHRHGDRLGTHADLVERVHVRYVLDGESSASETHLLVDYEVAGGRGTATRLRDLDALDQSVLANTTGGRPDEPIPSRGSFELAQPLAGAVLPRLAASGRVRWRTTTSAGRVQHAGDHPWIVGLDLDRGGYEDLEVRAFLHRDGERVGLEEVECFTPVGPIARDGRLIVCAAPEAVPWLATLARGDALRASDADAGRLLDVVSALPGIERWDGIRLDAAGPCAPRLSLDAPADKLPDGEVMGSLGFDYDDFRVAACQGPELVFLEQGQRALRRDLAEERRRLEEFVAAGGHLRDVEDAPRAMISRERWRIVLPTLLRAGWQVEAQQRRVRRPSDVRLRVRSGIDWFDLDGAVCYGGERAPLAHVLDAQRRGEQVVTLSDGSYGAIPDETFEEWRTLEELAERDEDSLRVARTRAGALEQALDALDEAGADVDRDDSFDTLVRRLDSLREVEARTEPVGFQGTLRAYQRVALGWLHALRRIGFGGCLADDMGLGKTVQVLAWLEERRTASDRTHPTLLVAPRSLLFNWRDEAARFTPNLRVAVRCGRSSQALVPVDVDLVLTTYGTVRSDPRWEEPTFDTVVLDEAQAIKNASSATARSVRALNASHRLALSGTPIENRLSELGSLFEFLNPGMLTPRSPTDEEDAERQRSELADALRPFLLRRTKAQVLTDLPEKSEHVLLCEMEPAQEEAYRQRRDASRDTLLGQPGEHGASSVQVLEALLRLRQIACHPGLVDETRTSEQSGKLAVLLPRLHELVASGHKALVFSQFTRFLGIVRSRLEEEGLPFRYLDGATRDRQAEVNAFQDDPDCGVFLISLAAGGTGLNLTAADYVFLLDPWWNPALESQAIDRSHRMGQRRTVCAYRLISRGTVEEKVLELQERKRKLVEALLTEENATPRAIRREDLEMLLGRS